MKKFLASLRQTYLNQAFQTISVVIRRTQAQLRPHHAWTHHASGRAFLAQEQWQAAVEACQKAIKLDPSCLCSIKP